MQPKSVTPAKPASTASKRATSPAPVAAKSPPASVNEKPGKKQCQWDTAHVLKIIVKLVGFVAAPAIGYTLLLWKDVKFTRDKEAQKVSLRWLYEILIPGLALVALTLTVLLGIRALFKHEKFKGSKLEKYGTKCLILSASSILFAFSCAYRALNIADEGAFTCRGKPTPFNAPWAGRFVATIGEIALVVQILVYIVAASERLGVKQSNWYHVCKKITSIPFTTIVPVLIAETCSWCGVLFATPVFFCMEYILWCIIALTWAWDGANLLHHSKSPKDQIVHGSLLVAGLALLIFNLGFEIPHFLWYDRSEDEGSGHGGPPAFVTIFECSQDEDSPLWLKRLPFFVTYFIGNSWASMALLYQVLSRIHGEKKKR